MTVISNLYHPLQNVFAPKNVSLARNVTLTLLGATLLAFASQLSIPMQPVPLTFQSATVLLIGLMFGSRLGTSMVASYLIAGACGLPVFADAAFGVAAFTGPTGGYLIGFLPAVALTGWLAEKGFAKNSFSAFAASLLGASSLFLLGYLWLAQFVGWHTAYLVGVKVFLVTEAIKLACAAIIAPRCWRKAY
jgi:biotin transport system substrate-specific component